MGEMTRPSDGLPTALDVMHQAHQCLLAGQIERAQVWIAFAAELRAGRREQMIDQPLRVVSPVVPQADWDRATRRTVAPVPMPRPLRDELRTMDERPQRVITGQRYAFGVDGSGPAAVDAAFVDPDTIRRVADRLRDMPAEDAPEPVAGEPETDDERVRRFATGAAGPRPFVESSSGGFDAFARGRETSRPYVDPVTLRGDETTVLSGGDPNHCRHCGLPIYRARPEDVTSGHPYRHATTMQAVCSPPRGTDPQGDESYVVGSRTFADPGGLPYRPE